MITGQRGFASVPSFLTTYHWPVTFNTVPGFLVSGFISYNWCKYMHCHRWLSLALLACHSRQDCLLKDQRWRKGSVGRIFSYLQGLSPRNTLKPAGRSQGSGRFQVFSRNSGKKDNLIIWKTMNQVEEEIVEGSLLSWAGQNARWFGWRLSKQLASEWKSTIIRVKWDGIPCM